MLNFINTLLVGSEYIFYIAVTICIRAGLELKSTASSPPFVLTETENERLPFLHGTWWYMGSSLYIIQDMTRIGKKWPRGRFYALVTHKPE
jgi:hypothetical protein